ncbi:MAG: CBS domain-containing protein [Planctomycetota bacterium]|nr:MAG: CBS domain-containing protein [Planctomycetota bacterium]
MPTAQTLLDRKGTDVATVDQDATVLEAAQIMNERRVGALVCTAGERVVGIFTERDILRRVVAENRPPANTRVGDVMTTPMACCKRTTSLAACRALMTKKRIRHLPVVEDGVLHGIISSGDILASEVADQQDTIEYLHEYLYGRA